MEFLHPEDIPTDVNQTFAVRELGSASIPVPERGLKRKIEHVADEDAVSTSRQRTQQHVVPEAKGEVATPKPPSPK